MQSEHIPRIVVVGGGAGGLELATRLGDSLGKRKQASVTLIDSRRTHIWKPLLHQLAAGSLDTYGEEIEFIAQARWHHFKFRQGSLAQLDRQAKEIELAPLNDAEGVELLPAQRVAYDVLVLAIGSLANDFGTPGASEHAILLDDPDAARSFNEKLINACLRAQIKPKERGHGLMTVTIVGGGATGVELAAELHSTARDMSRFGLESMNPDEDFKIVIVEAGQRLLSNLPEKVSSAATQELRSLGVEIHVNERVTEVTADAVKMSSGKVIPTTLTVWAAGIKVAGFMKDFGGLETNKLNQIMTSPTLQTTRDPAIFALGDCAACPQEDGQLVPARAQAAHQQARHLSTQIQRYLTEKPLKPYVYKDRGSLVSLAQYSSVGNLMGSLTKGSMFVEGQIARFMYWTLHKQHQVALSGWLTTIFTTLAEWLHRVNRPRIKLH